MVNIHQEKMIAYNEGHYVLSYRFEVYLQGDFLQPIPVVVVSLLPSFLLVPVIHQFLFVYIYTTLFN